MGAVRVGVQRRSDAVHAAALSKVGNTHPCMAGHAPALSPRRGRGRYRSRSSSSRCSRSARTPAIGQANFRPGSSNCRCPRKCSFPRGLAIFAITRTRGYSALSRASGRRARRSFVNSADVVYRLDPGLVSWGLRPDKHGTARRYRSAGRDPGTLCRLPARAIAADGDPWRGCLRFRPAQREIVQPAPDGVDRLLDRGKGRL
jgi:hypothetical protein